MTESTDTATAPRSESSSSSGPAGQSLEELYTGPAPTPLFLLAEGLLEYDAGFSRWRFAHVQLVERIIGPVTGGTGGTLGARYLSRTVSQRFFPRLWAVRARFFERPVDV